MTEIQAHIVITGRVQGVYFRESTREEAERQGVVGWIRNLPSGQVEAIFQGTAAAVEALVQYCHVGPSTARIDGVTVERRTEVDHTLSCFRVLRRS